MTFKGFAPEKDLEGMADDFKKEKIREALSMCTEPQQVFFHRIYGEVATIPGDKLASAYGLIHRTLKKNREGR